MNYDRHPVRNCGRAFWCSDRVEKERDTAKGFFKKLFSVTFLP